jgi:hypothetical protein
MQPSTSTSTTALDAITSPPAYQLLDLRTVADAWREWKEGIAGSPAVKQLESVWGPKWRPSAAARTAFCRRKVIWDEIHRLLQAGLALDEAVGQLEALRNGKSLLRLAALIQQQRRK